MDEGHPDDVDSETEDDGADDNDDDDDEDKDGSQDSDAEDGPQDRQADGGGSSLLADVRPGGTAAVHFQAAEEHTRSRATQLVRSLAEDHPDFKEVKQEVFARNSSSDRTPMPDADADAAGAASAFDTSIVILTRPLSLIRLTPVAASTPERSANSSGAEASQSALYTDTAPGQSN